MFEKSIFYIVASNSTFLCWQFKEMFLCSCINCLTSHNIEITCVYTTIIIIEREFTHVLGDEYKNATCMLFCPLYNNN